MNQEIERPFEEEFSGHIEVAKEALKYLLGFNPDTEDFDNEKLLIIKTKGEEHDEEDLARIVEYAGKSIAPELGRVKVIEIEKDFSEEEARQLVQEYQFIFNISSMTHRGNLFREISGSKVRLVSPIGMGTELFKPDGVLSENVSVIKERMNNMHELLRKAVGFRIKAPDGTDLSVRLKKGFRRWSMASGEIREGEWDNWPGGEVYTTPDEFAANGKMVLWVIDTAESNLQVSRDGKPVVFEIRDGLIVSITGGEMADRLKSEFASYMRENQADINEERLLKGNVSKDKIDEFKRDITFNVLRIAEIGFGSMNCARIPNGRNIVPTVEGEKKFGTCHIAFGSGIPNEEGVDGFFDSSNHYDFVLFHLGLVVEMFENEDDLKNGKNGIEIIRDRNFLI